MVCDTPNDTMSSIRSVSKGKINIFFQEERFLGLDIHGSISVTMGYWARSVHCYPFCKMQMALVEFGSYRGTSHLICR